jgi:hypothetical protein
MANNITQLKIGTTTYDINDNRIITLADNSTATAGTWLAKTSQISAYADGQIFLYKITKAGASTTTLNITGSAGTALGAKTIYRSGTSKLTTHYGVGQYLLLAYNSTNDCFRVVNDYDANTTYGGGAGIIVSGGLISNSGVRSISTGSTNGTISVDTGGTSVDVAVKGLGSAAYTNSNSYLTAHQTIKQDGVTGATANHYGSCTTAAATPTKVVSLTAGTFNLETGARIIVKFTYKNTANNPTLNVNSKGAKNIFYNGVRITTGTNKGMLYGACEFIYDGTQFHLVSPAITYETIGAAPAGHGHSGYCTVLECGTYSELGALKYDVSDDCYENCFIKGILGSSYF